MFSDEPTTPRRRWVATTVATLAMQFSYWALVGGVASGSSGDGDTGLGLLALGLALVPFVLMAAALASRHRNAPLAVMKGLGLFIAIGATLALALVFLPGAAVVGTVAGYAAAAVVSLRREEDVPLRPRVVAAVAATVWVALLLAVGIGPFGIMSGAVLPFAAITFADEVVAVRATSRAE